jgi:hypothetical protein
MAGVVRQPIDVQSLERFISQNVPEIKTPIDIKQVTFHTRQAIPTPTSLISYSLDLDNQIPHTSLQGTMEPDS